VSAKPSLWKLGGLTPLQLGKRVNDQLTKDEVSVRSASLAYYFILAVFPALLFVISIVGFFAAVNAQFQQELFTNMSRMLPGSAADLVHKTIEQVSVGSGTWKIVAGILGALWAASSGVTAVMGSLNVAYDVKETRPWWKQKAIAIGLTFALAVLVIAALAITLFGGMAADFVGSHLGLGNGLVLAWKIVQWPVVLALMFAAFALTYYAAPNLKEPEWHWITPGSALGLIAWLAASIGFKIYLHFFNSYSKTYGSLGAVIILLVWLYITGYVILVGGEINSEIGRAADARADHEKKLRSINEGRAAA
jgi:membrane protein